MRYRYDGLRSIRQNFFFFVLGLIAFSTGCFPVSNAGSKISKPENEQIEYAPEVHAEGYKITFDKMTIHFEKAILKVEVANSPKKVQRGLMHRRKLGANEGMIFVYPKPLPLSFWNKNTFLDLDLAYIDEHGKLLEIIELSALSSVMETPTSYPASQKAKFAIEANRGWFQRNNIVVGSARLPTEVLKKLKFVSDNLVH